MGSYGVCPACQIEKPLQTHHWRYREPERTVEICHACHMRIHRNMTVEEQAKATDMESWIDDALAELVALHRRHRQRRTPVDPVEIKALYDVPFADGRILGAYVERYADCRHTYQHGTGNCRDCGAFVGFDRARIYADAQEGERA
jgi:hypothetical protein